MTNLNANNISSGTLAVAHGGTGSTTQNFVDLTNTQTIGGAKTFSAGLSTAAITSSGNVTAVGFFNSSARALKTDIGPLSFDALEAVNAVEIVRYRYKDGDGQERIGFIADDAPVELSPERLTFDVSRVLAVSLRAVQQLTKRVEQLERERA